MPSSECVFCQVVHRSVSAEIVFEDEHVVAFLDRAPVFHGHVLVSPREHVVTLPDLAPSAIAPLFSRVQLVARVLPTALDAHGTFVAINNIVSQSVAHLHVHVVPRRRKDGLRGFFWPRQRYADGEAAAYASVIRAALAGAVAHEG